MKEIGGNETIMAISTGQCLACRAINAYTALNCIECGAKLPWADAVQSVSTQPQPQAQPQQPPLPPALPESPYRNPMQRFLFGNEPWSQTNSASKTVFSLSSLPPLGVVMLLGGLAGAFYCAFIFDVYSPVVQVFGQPVKVVNVKLMEERQGGLFFSVCIAILGAVMIANYARKESS